MGRASITRVLSCLLTGLTGLTGLTAGLLVPAGVPAVADPGAARETCTIRGTAADDVLTGTTGADVICGLGGDDRIVGNGGADILKGGPGADTLDGGAGRDQLRGGAGDDVLLGGPDRDDLFGGPGADDLRGGDADDQLRGGEDDDALRGDGGRDLLNGLSGDDSLYGGPGDDRLRGEDAARFRDSLDCGPGAADVAAGDPVDTVTATCETGGPNRAPVAVDDAAGTDEDNALQMPARGPGSPVVNDTDADRDPLVVSAVGPAEHGTVALAGGTITFTPAEDHCGPATFEYVVSDGRGGTDTGTVAVTVACVDDLAVAADDAVEVGEDSGATTIDVLANDDDPDGDARVVAITQPQHGSVVLAEDGADVSYTPAADQCDDDTPDTFTYTVSGGATATVAVTVACVDDPSVAVDDAAEIEEDAGATPVDVLANDSDVEGDPLVIASATQPAHGTVVVAEDGSGLTYAPDADFCSTTPDTFDYTLEDGGTATVAVTVTCVVDPAQAVDDAAEVEEDAAATALDVLANDDPRDGTLEIDDATQPARGTVVVADDGSGLTYRPEADACGPDDFTYSLVGGSSATVTVTVACVDDPSVARDDAATVEEDAAATPIDVLANDSDVEGDALVVASTTEPAHGTVVVAADGSGLTYAPDADFCSVVPDTFDYTLADGGTATVSVTVTCVTDQAVAVDDAAELTEDDPATRIDVLANDESRDVTLEIASVTQPAAGTVVITDSGAYLTYEPDADTCTDGGDADAFTYTLTGGSTATVDVTVACVVDPAVAVDDTAEVVEDDPATAIDVLANDDARDAELEIVSATQPANGTVVVAEDGADLTYEPDADYCNDPPGTTPDTFDYTLAGGSSATVAVTVDCVTDPSVAADDDAEVDEDSGASAIDVLANDDPRDTTLAIDSTTQPAHGTVVVTGGGTGLTYEPDANHCDDDAADSFTYTLVGGSSATVDVTVTCVADPPVADDETFTFVGNTFLLVNDPSDAGPTITAIHRSTVGDVRAGDVDPEGGPLTVTAGTFTTADGGSVTIQPDGDFLFTPAPGCSDAIDSFDYTVTDEEGASGTGTVTLIRDQCVWYVDNAATGNAGTATAPFDTLAQAQAASAPAHTIYVFGGDGTATGQAAGITLKSAQRLIGEAAALRFGAEVLAPADPAARPQLAATDADVITLASSTTVAGVAVDPAGAGGGISGSAIQNPTLTDIRVVDTATPGQQPGIELVSVSGAVAVADLYVAGGRGVQITNSPASATTFTGDLTVSTNAGGGLVTSNAGTLTVPDAATAAISSVGGPAVDLTSTSSNVSLDAATSTGSSGDGINVDGLGQSAVFVVTAGSISGAAGIGFDVAGGNGTIRYGGTISDGSGPLSVEVTARTGGTVELSGQITDGPDAGGGIALAANTGGSTLFSGAGTTLVTGSATGISMGTSDGHTLRLEGGGLRISTSNGMGINATTSGTLLVSGAGNTIDAVGARALGVVQTDIAAGGLTFQRISALGGTNGIVLDTTGSQGGLTVTGAGGLCTAAVTAGCSGGAIRLLTGGDDSSTAPVGTGVVLTRTVNPSLARMWIADSDNYAVRGDSLTGLTLTDSVVNGLNGTSTAPPYDEASIRLTNLTGTVTITDTHVSGGAQDNLAVVNSVGSLDRITLTRVTFGTNGARPANDALLLSSAPTAGALRATIAQSTFSSAGGDLLQYDHGGAGAGDLVVTGSTFANGHPSISAGGGGVALTQTGTSGTTTMTVTGNSFSGAVGSAVLLAKGAGGSQQQGVFANNSIGTTGNTGSLTGSGLKLQQYGGGSMAWTVQANTIVGYNAHGIEVVAGGTGAAQSGSLQTRVIGNVVRQPGSAAPGTAKHGLLYNIGTATGDTYVACAEITGNTLDLSGADTVPPSGTDVDVRLRQRQLTTVRLPGYAGAANGDAAVAAFVSAANPGGTTTLATNTVSGGAPGFVGGAACSTPAVP